MCDPITGTLLAVGASALIGGGASVYNAQKQQAQAKKAQAQAQANAQAQLDLANKQANKQAAKAPNVDALRANNAAQQAGGASTLLTSPAGVDPTSLTLSKPALLGA